MPPSTSPILFLFIGWLLLLASSASATAPRVMKVVDVSPVWPGQPTGFQLITRQDRQFVAFYDAQRRMVVGSRDLDSDKWEFKILPPIWGGMATITSA